MLEIRATGGDRHTTFACDDDNDDANNETTPNHFDEPTSLTLKSLSNDS